MKYALISIFIMILFACSEEETISSDELMTIVQECTDSKLESASAISSNLIGEWNLIGYGCGFCANHDNNPVSSLEFDQEQGKIYYQDLYLDTMIQFDWSIQKGTTIFGENTFVLETEPSFYVLQFELFCKDYISFDHTPVDGPMYLFKKK
jgi:hypothetical protein